MWLLSLSMNQAYSQSNNNIQKNLLKGNLLWAPSVNYERALTDAFVAKVEAGVSFTVFDNFGVTSLGFFPKFEGQLKYYYNFDRRLTKNKSISRNSGGFVAVGYQFQDDKALFNEVQRVSDFSHLGALWGFQKTYDYGLSLLFEAGFGYDFAYELNSRDSNGRPFPLIGFELVMPLGINEITFYYS